MNTRFKSFSNRLKRNVRYRFPLTRPRRVLFDHLPKCGGSTLTAYLELHYPKDRIYLLGGAIGPREEAIERFKNLPAPARRRYGLIAGHDAHLLVGCVAADCVKVTLLRDPVERIVSHYYYAKATPQHYLHQSIHERGISLEDYATSGLSDELRNWYTSHFSQRESEEAERAPDEAIAAAVEAVAGGYDVVGFLDDLSPFIERLRVSARLRYRYRGGRVNVTAAKPKAKAVSPAAIRSIEQANELDVEFYRRLREAVA